MLSLPAKEFYFRTGPRSSTPTVLPQVPGTIAVIAVSTTAAVLDLGLLFPQGADVTASGASASSTFADQLNGAQGNRIAIYADGADIGIITSPDLAGVTLANVPALAATGAVSATGIYTSAAKTCWRILAGTTFEFIPTISQDRFLGFVGSASGHMRLFQISGSMGLGVG